MGEVTPDSAVVWMRLTRHTERNRDGLDLRGKGGEITVPEGVSVESLEGAVPGAPGRVRFRYSSSADLSRAAATPWVDVGNDGDYTHQFRLTSLEPDTLYHYAAETSGPGGSPVHEPLHGRFRTAPPTNEPQDFTFVVVTCFMYCEMGAPDGFRIFDAIRELDPSFAVFTGDNVYYDNESPRATTAAVARYHWQRMFSFAKHTQFFLNVPTYWQKDDHDTLDDDCWPGRQPERMEAMTFDQGQRIFLEQAPHGPTPYRSVRWGKRAQLWLMEGRDFRSPNDMPDGPDKTIWGGQQKQWLKQTLPASDARWKFVVSPTPILGPDRPRKSDNHANDAFAYEGNEVREWIRDHSDGDIFAINGDRHWQYHSVDPDTGLNEFCSGPPSDEHAAGTPGDDPSFHRFHRVAGGFLSVTVSENSAFIRHHDVSGAVVYEYRETIRA